MAEPQGWVHCHDPFGRDRSMAVFVDQDRVLLVSPPGESAVLSAQQIRRLRTLLDEVARSRSLDEPDIPIGEDPR
jgi:hypothetical protein